MKPLHAALALAALVAAGCEQMETMQGSRQEVPLMTDPSPHAGPVESLAEPTDGAMNEIGPDGDG